MQTNRELIVEPIGLDVETLPRPIVWRDLFGNDNPVEIEIGMGKGTFLTDQAKARPGGRGIEPLAVVGNGEARATGWSALEIDGDLRR